LKALPRLHLRLFGNATWMQLWQSTAECAADDDAVRGDAARACLLAETLVAGSRQLTAQNQHVVATMLVSSLNACDDPGWQRTTLESRIDRLLFQLPAEPAKQGLLPLLFTTAVLGVTAGLVSMAPGFHELSEYLLHLG
jgi:hypothetical protein